MQNYFESWHKVTNITWIDITLMSSLQYLDMYFYVLGESEVVAQKSFIKKLFLNIPRNSEENICA